MSTIIPHIHTSCVSAEGIYIVVRIVQKLVILKMQRTIVFALEFKTEAFTECNIFSEVLQRVGMVVICSNSANHPMPYAVEYLLICSQ